MVTAFFEMFVSDNYMWYIRKH